MVDSMKGNGKTAKEMELVNASTRVEVCRPENGKTKKKWTWKIRMGRRRCLRRRIFKMIKKTEKEKEKGYTRMGVYMMESG